MVAIPVRDRSESRIRQLVADGAAFSRFGVELA
jgi:hypothetical protein